MLLTRRCSHTQGIDVCAHRLLSDAEAAELRSSSNEFREAEGIDMPAQWKGTSCLMTGECLTQVQLIT